MRCRHQGRSGNPTAHEPDQRKGAHISYIVRHDNLLQSIGRQKESERKSVPRVSCARIERTVVRSVPAKVFGPRSDERICPACICTCPYHGSSANFLFILRGKSRPMSSSYIHDLCDYSSTRVSCITAGSGFMRVSNTIFRLFIPRIRPNCSV